MSGPVAEALAALGRALAGRRWYVFGAQAAVSYGRPRLTADVDVTVEAHEDDPDALLEALASAGLTPRMPGFAELVERARVMPLVHVATGLPVDVVLAGPGLEQEFLARARPIDLGGGCTVPLISPEDLVATKVLAGRPKDLEDVAGILHAQQGVLDVSRIRSVLAALEEALERADLLPAFEALLGKAVPAAGEPTRKKPRRRS